MSEAATLERIANEYLQPDPGRVVDRQFLDWTASRLMTWIQGPEVLELGVGDEKWTGKILERFGHDKTCFVTNLCRAPFADARSKADGSPVTSASNRRSSARERAAAADRRPDVQRATTGTPAYHASEWAPWPGAAKSGRRL